MKIRRLKRQHQANTRFHMSFLWGVDRVRKVIVTEGREMNAALMDVYEQARVSSTAPLSEGK